MRPRRLSLVAALVALAACASTPETLQTPEGRAAYYADQVADRIGAVQAAVIEANRLGAVPDPTAIAIVRGTVSALRVIRETPAGWLTSVDRTWAEVKAALGAEVAGPPLAALVAAVDALLVTVRTGGVR